MKTVSTIFVLWCLFLQTLSADNYKNFPDGTYYIQPVSQGDPDWDWSVDCHYTTKIQQWVDWHRNENQQFVLTKLFSGWYKIQCKNNVGNNLCWSRPENSIWITQNTCNTNDAGHQFKFITTTASADQFIISIKKNGETVGIRSTDNNNGEQLHADSSRSGNNFQRFKIIPLDMVQVMGSITHIGLNYGSDEGVLSYISGTTTYDNLCRSGSGFPISTKWTDRLNNRHIIQMTGSGSDFSLYVPSTSEITWYQPSGSDTTGLDGDTLWVHVKFSYVSGGWFSSHGIRVEVRGYAFQSNSFFDWDKIKEAIARGKDVVDIVSSLSAMGQSIYHALHP